MVPNMNNSHVNAFIKAADLNNHGVIQFTRGLFPEAIQTFNQALIVLRDLITILENPLQQAQVKSSASCSSTVVLGCRLSSSSGYVNDHDDDHFIPIDDKQEQSYEKHKASRKAGTYRGMEGIAKGGNFCLTDDDDMVVLFNDPLYIEIVQKDADSFAGRGASDENPMDFFILTSQSSMVDSEAMRLFINLSVVTIVLNAATSYHWLHLSNANNNNVAQDESKQRVAKNQVAAQRLYRKCIDLIMILDASNRALCVLQERESANLRKICNLVLLASMNNLLSIMDREDLNRSSVRSVYSQHAIMWSHEDDNETTGPRHARQEQASLPQLDDEEHDDHSNIAETISLPLICRKWRPIFLGNAVMMQLESLGTFRRSYTAVAA